MTLQTRNIPLTFSDIPDTWIYEHYLKVPSGILTGGDHKIRSPWTRDSDPSFSIYKPSNGGPYRWHDLSCGRKGNTLDLIIQLKEISGDNAHKIAAQMVKDDYIAYLAGNGSHNSHTPTAQLENKKGRVTNFELRPFHKVDLTWWLQWGITLPTLEKYNVAPMKCWTMEKTVDGDKRIMTFENPLAFGYMTKHGELGRIYQPMLPRAKGKFIKVAEGWMQGRDQLQYKYPELLIMSSLKDAMAFEELGFLGYEFLIPDSESLLIPLEDLAYLKSKYTRMRVFFDNDEGGRISAKKYLDQHGLQSINLPMAKDLSDSIRDYNQLLVKIELLPLL